MIRARESRNGRKKYRHRKDALIFLPPVDFSLPRLSAPRYPRRMILEYDFSSSSFNINARATSNAMWNIKVSRSTG